jgi:hypothetical protein
MLKKKFNLFNMSTAERIYLQQKELNGISSYRQTEDIRLQEVMNKREAEIAERLRYEMIKKDQEFAERLRYEMIKKDQEIAEMKKAKEETEAEMKRDKEESEAKMIAEIKRLREMLMGQQRVFSGEEKQELKELDLFLSKDQPVLPNDSQNYKI